MVVDSYETATGEIAKIRWKKRKKVTSVHRLWLHWHHDKLSVFLRGHWTFEIILPAIIGLIDDGRMSVAFFASTSEKMKLPMNVEKKNIGKMSITETHAQRADQTLKANTRKRKVASAGGWRQVPKSDPHYQELVYIVPTSLPSHLSPPTPHWILQSTRSKTFFIVDFTQLFHLIYMDRLLK